MCQFSGKTDNFDFSTQICPKMDFGVGISEIYVQIQDQHLRETMCANFGGLDLGKLLNYLRYFSSNKVEGVAESWAEAEMNWVEVGAWFSNTHFFNLKEK